MIRFLATATAVMLSLCRPALAASDITIAAIATGRLYVVGNTERPHTAVTLEDQFRTESDDQGKFQYELVYHPARCIVSAVIDGKAHEAVVTNCGQQCQVSAPEKALQPGAALPPTIKPTPAAGRKPTGTPAAAEPGNAAIPADVRPSAPAAVSGPNGTAAKDSRLPGSESRSASTINRPPLPPPRPTSKPAAQTRSAQPARTPQRPKPAPQAAPDDRDALPED